MKIKVLSWNIWGGYFIDLPGVIDFLKLQSPDVICLQEVVEKESNQAKIISEKLGYGLHDFRVFKTDRHETIYSLGNAVLTRFPIKKTDSVMLSDLSEYKKDWETEPRGLTKVSIEVNRREIEIMTVHLAYSKDFAPSKMRDKQASRILEEISGKSTILAGDFNSLPDSKIIKSIEVKMHCKVFKPEKKTWPVRERENPKVRVDPRDRIDYIFASPDVEVVDFEVLQDYSSDHFPIMATLEV